MHSRVCGGKQRLTSKNLSTYDMTVGSSQLRAYTTLLQHLLINIKY